MRMILRALRVLDRQWLSDLIAACCLFGLLWATLVAGAVLG